MARQFPGGELYGWCSWPFHRQRLFRQYEIIYVVADERDLVRLRSNYREKVKGEVTG